MSQDVKTLTQAIELVAAGSWAVDAARKCLETGDPERARAVLDRASESMRQGLEALRDVLDETVRESYDRPAKLALALESLQELRSLA